MDNRVKQAMMVAKDLIQEKKYYEARILLQTIDHPKAREWIAKLDKVAIRPPDSVVEPSKSKPSLPQHNDLAAEQNPGQGSNTSAVNQTGQKKSSGGCLSLLGTLFLCAIIYSIFASNLSTNETQPSSEAEKVLSEVFPRQSAEVFSDSDYVSVTLAVSQFPFRASPAYDQLNENIVEAICKMKSSGYSRHRFEFDVTHGTVRTSVGTSMPDIILIITVSSSTAQRLNCFSYASNDLADVADIYIWSDD